MTYLDVELAIVGHFGYRQNIIVPNYYINFGTGEDHECDLIIVKRSGYAIEVEIKMSKADLKADLKKKHGHIDERLQYLYYAMPEELYDKCKDIIPDHAGVFVVIEYSDYKGGWTKLIRRPEKKKCRKLTTEEMLKIAHLGAMRIWKLKAQRNENTQVPCLG